jgi:hypothetical protein
VNLWSTFIIAVSSSSKIKRVVAVASHSSFSQNIIERNEGQNIEFNIGTKFANENLNQYCQITLFCVGDTFS